MTVVAKVWSVPDRGGPVYFARLIFDRKQSDGETVHCEVPRVEIGHPPINVGARIKVAPQATSCWEPDIICETCAAPSDAIALDTLIAGGVSGFISFLLFWVGRHERNKPA